MTRKHLAAVLVACATVLYMGNWAGALHYSMTKGVPTNSTLIQWGYQMVGREPSVIAVCALVVAFVLYIWNRGEGRKPE